MGEWKKEVARDIIALGGIPFYAITLIRVFAGENLEPFYTLTYQFFIAAALIYLASLIIKSSNNYVSRSFALLFFTSLNYKDLYYTLFASVLWILLLASLIYLKKKKADILRGLITGLLSTFASHLVVKYLLPLTNLPF